MLHDKFPSAVKWESSEEKLNQGRNVMIRTYPGVGNLTVCRYPGVGNLAPASIKMSNSPTVFAKVLKPQLD